MKIIMKFIKLFYFFCLLFGSVGLIFQAIEGIQEKGISLSISAEYNLLLAALFFLVAYSSEKIFIKKN